MWELLFPASQSRKCTERNRGKVVIAWIRLLPKRNAQLWNFKGESLLVTNPPAQSAGRRKRWMQMAPGIYRPGWFWPQLCIPGETLSRSECAESADICSHSKLRRRRGKKLSGCPISNVVEEERHKTIPVSHLAASWNTAFGLRNGGNPFTEEGEGWIHTQWTWRMSILCSECGQVPITPLPGPPHSTMEVGPSPCHSWQNCLEAAKLYAY